jgi:hypothetical protein
MDAERLRKYRSIVYSIKAIREQIEALYEPIASPNGKDSVSFGGEPGNPTEKSAFRIIEMREQLESREQELREMAEEIEDWLITVNDAEMEAIIRIHFFLGESWQSTSRKVYGKDSKDSARKRFKRFMAEQAEKN